MDLSHKSPEVGSKTSDSGAFDLVVLPSMASRLKVTSWFKMAARAPHHLPVLSGRKEKRAKRDALTFLLQHIPEVASAYIPLAKLSHMAIPHLAANRGWGLCGLYSGRGAHVQPNTGDFMSKGEEEGGYL